MSYQPEAFARIPDKTLLFLERLDNFRSITFLDQHYRPRKGFIALAKRSISRKAAAGKRYCLSFVLAGEKEYYEKCITFHLFHYYHTAEYYLGSFSYASESSLLEDFSFLAH